MCLSLLKHESSKYAFCMILPILLININNNRLKNFECSVELISLFIFNVFINDKNQSKKLITESILIEYFLLLFVIIKF